MFLNLLIKEFKNGALFTKLKKGNFLSIFLTLIVSLAFIILEVYLFRMLNKKLMAFNNASEAFLNIFLFAITIIQILYLTTLVRKTLFSKEDEKILLNKPVNPMLNMLSKIVFIYLRNVLMNFIVAFPILYVYGYDTYATSRVLFLMFLYPFIISIFETGVSYLLSIPFQFVYNFFKKHFVIQVVISSCISIGLCYGYSFILKAFLTLVRDNNIYAIFSKDVIDHLYDVAEYLFPTHFYIQALHFNIDGLIFILAISIFIFIVGILVSSKVYYLSLTNETYKKKREVKDREIKIYSQNKALVLKELKLYFEESNSVFSFSSLLLMQPFLTLLVIQAMNTIFKTGTLSYVSSYFKYLLPIIQILFVSLFATFINTASSFVISREKFNGVRICKMIPVSYRKHVLIKMLVPFSLSMVSLLISVIVLMITKQISVGNGFLALIFAIVMIIFLELVSINEDLKAPRSGNKESNKSALISLLSILIPVISVSGIFVLSFFKIPLIGSFMIVFLLLVLLLIGYGFYFYKKIAKRFIALEMRN